MPSRHSASGKEKKLFFPPDGAKSDDNRSDKTKDQYRSSSTGRALPSRSGSFQRGDTRSGDNRSGPYNTTQDIDRMLFTYDKEGQEADFLSTRKALCEWAVTKCPTGRFLYALVMKGVEKKFDDPIEPAKTASDYEIRKHFRELDEVRRNKEKYETDTASFLMFSLSRCTPPLRRRLDTMTKPKALEDIIADVDLKNLYTAMQGIVFHTVEDGKVNEYIMQARNWRRLMDLPPSSQLELYGKRFNAQWEALETLWGRVQPQKLVGKAQDKQVEAAGKFKAALFLTSVDQRRYKPVIDSLHSDFLKGQDNYPKSVEAMITLLQQRRDVVGNYRTENSFAQEELTTDEVEDVYEEEGTLSEEFEHQQTEQQPAISWNMPDSSRARARSKSPHPNTKEAWNYRAGL